MSKYQEALKRLRTNEYLTSREQRRYYNLLQELVDKETPMKPVFKQVAVLPYEKKMWHCSKCDITVGWGNCYCNNCGQKLDWSDCE